MNVADSSRVSAILLSLSALQACDNENVIEDQQLANLSALRRWWTSNFLYRFSLVNPFDGLEGLPVLEHKFGPVPSYVLRECL